MVLSIKAIVGNDIDDKIVFRSDQNILKDFLDDKVNAFYVVG